MSSIVYPASRRAFTRRRESASSASFQQALLSSFQFEQQAQVQSLFISAKKYILFHQLTLFLPRRLESVIAACDGCSKVSRRNVARVNPGSCDHNLTVTRCGTGDRFVVGGYVPHDSASGVGHEACQFCQMSYRHGGE